MIYVAHEQGSARWLAWRRSGIGGSEAASVLGLSPWKTRRKLFLELTGQSEPEAANYAMRRGNRKEEEGRRQYQRRTGSVMEPVCGEHNEHRWLRASLDGLSFDGDVVLEIKWPNWGAHQGALDGQVPEYYWPQVQQQLLVSGAERLHYWSCSENQRFGMGQRFALVEVLPCQDYHELLVSELGTFWAEVMEFARTAR